MWRMHWLVLHAAAPGLRGLAKYTCVPMVDDWLAYPVAPSPVTLYAVAASPTRCRMPGRQGPVAGTHVRGASVRVQYSKEK